MADTESDDAVMSIMPLGGGQEVGRSCILFKFRGCFCYSVILFLVMILYVCREEYPIGLRYTSGQRRSERSTIF